MQLLLILAIILLGGKPGTQNILNEVVPVLESIGGNDLSGEFKQAVKSAEEISSCIAALGALATPAPSQNAPKEEVTATPAGEPPFLRPVSAIAPSDVQTALESYLKTS